MGVFQILRKPWNHGSIENHPFPKHWCKPPVFAEQNSIHRLSNQAGLLEKIAVPVFQRCKNIVIPWMEPHFANGARLLARCGSLQRGRVYRSMMENCRKWLVPPVLGLRINATVFCLLWPSVPAGLVDSMLVVFNLKRFRIWLLIFIFAVVKCYF